MPPWAIITGKFPSASLGATHGDARFHPVYGGGCRLRGEADGTSGRNTLWNTPPESGRMGRTHAWLRDRAFKAQGVCVQKAGDHEGYGTPACT